MKKLFTLVALLAVFMGAKAEWVQDYKIDYSQKTGFPFFVMGYVPEWIDGVMTDYGADYRYATQADLDGDGDAKWKEGESSVGTVTNAGGTEYQKVTGAGPYWHQYIIAADVPMELDQSYTVKALIKSSADVEANLQFGNWGSLVETKVKIPAGDFQEVEWEVSGCTFAGSGFICIQPGTSTATIEWKSLVVGHNAKAAAPTVWQEWLTNDGKSVVVEKEVKDIANWMGGAEFGGWPSWALETTNGINANWRGDRTGEICAWALTMGRNFDNENTVINEDSPRARPFPADIEPEPGNESNHVFAVHVTQIAPIEAPTPDENSVAWSNQFWIQSPKGWKAGTKVRIKFRYKADKACSVGTQIHKRMPSDYLFWNAVGDVAFTTEWQEFSKDFDFSNDTNDGWSLAFNLNSDADNGRTAPINFYFDDLSWQTMVLDEGFFVASSNSATGIEYDFATATEFVTDPEDAEVVYAIVGEKGKKDTWVNQIMISTVRGDDAAFKGATIKPTEAITSGEWLGFTEATLAKINLPAAGVWKIQIAPADKQICFTQIEGEAAKEPVDIVTNATEVVVKGQERDDIKDDDHPEGTGAAWDNQFFIVANRVLDAGEVTHLKFSYKASKVAKTTTQTHGTPGAYIHWAAIGDVNFTEDWQTFDADYTVPNEAAGKNAQSIAFNMAEIKDACDYYIKDVQWFLKYEVEGKTMENLIDAEGTKNFYVKEGAGTNPYQYGTETGITNVTAKSVKASDVIYNIAGQRVNKDFKGLVIMDGKKIVK